MQVKIRKIYMLLSYLTQGQTCFEYIYISCNVLSAFFLLSCSHIFTKLIDHRHA